MTPYMTPPKWIGQIRAIWAPKKMANELSSPILSLAFGSLTTSCNTFYGMRALKLHPEMGYVYIDVSQVVEP